MTPSGIEPATFRFVAQHLKPLCHRGPIILEILYTKIKVKDNLHPSKLYKNYPQCQDSSPPQISLYDYAKNQQTP